MEDDCREAGGRATQGAVAEVEPRLDAVEEQLPGAATGLPRWAGVAMI